MGDLNPNLLNPNKSALEIRGYFLTSNIYMKVSCLRPLTLVPLVSGGRN